MPFTGLWYQTIKPFNVSKGTFRPKNACPIIEKITGIVPAKQKRTILSQVIRIDD